MIKNINEYFSNDYEFYLDKVEYIHKKKTHTTSEYVLNCLDKLETNEISDEQLEVKVTRSLAFSPDHLYNLNVTFVAVLSYNMDKKKELEELSSDLSKDLISNGQFFLSNIMSRISLLISDITASYGQPPVISPPVIAPVQ